MPDDKNYCIISCGLNRQKGNGGHCRNDKSSLELCIDRKDIIVDSRTYTHTAEPKLRHKFRSTAYHNAVVVDKKEHNRFDEKNLFVPSEAGVKINKWQMSDEIDIFTGKRYGYKRPSHSVIYQREIKFHKKERKLEIMDKFRGEGEHGLKWNLILSPGFKATNLKIDSRKLQWHKKPAFYSSEYGMITKTEKLASTLKTKIPVEVKFCIEI